MPYFECVVAMTGRVNEKRVPRSIVAAVAETQVENFARHAVLHVVAFAQKVARQINLGLVELLAGDGRVDVPSV